MPFDEGALSAWLNESGLLSGPAQVTRIGDGHSNLTYLVDDGLHRLVVRRPPPPPLPPGANDVLREARILQALAGTPVPVPRVEAVVPAGAVMDVPFYVMEHLEGAVVTDALPPALDTAQRRRDVAHAMVDAMIGIHALDWRAHGLGDLGRPDGFVERQLRRLPRLIADRDGVLPAPFSELRDRLLATVPSPSGDGALVHGDLRLGNLMLGTAPPARVIGVLDWELATIGDPMADLAYTLTTYAVPGEPLHALTAMSTATLAPGFPNREALAQRYASATGRDVSGLGWYQALQLFKLAVLFEYSRARSKSGGDDYYDDPALVAGLIAAAEGAVRPPSARNGKDRS